MEAIEPTVAPVTPRNCPGDGDGEGSGATAGNGGGECPELRGLRCQEGGQLNVSWFSKFNRNYRRDWGEIVVDGCLTFNLSG